MQHKVFSQELHEVLNPAGSNLEGANLVGANLESAMEAYAFAQRLEAELKASRDNAEWPEWAKQALAAGWKAPKGWKP